jgi:DNA-binding transcriptional ArsR family regulator
MDKPEALAEIFKALSDPTRLRLLQLLSKNATEDDQHCCNGAGFLCVNALAHRLGVTQSAVSQHLRVLRLAGLVKSERRGHFVHYSPDREGIEKCGALLKETLGQDLAQ